MRCVCASARRVCTHVILEATKQADIKPNRQILCSAVLGFSGIEFETRKWILWIFPNKNPGVEQPNINQGTRNAEFEIPQLNGMTFSRSVRGSRRETALNLPLLQLDLEKKKKQLNQNRVLPTATPGLPTATTHTHVAGCFECFQLLFSRSLRIGCFGSIVAAVVAISKRTRW